MMMEVIMIWYSYISQTKDLVLMLGQTQFKLNLRVQTIFGEFGNILFPVYFFPTCFMHTIVDSQ